MSSWWTRLRSSLHQSRLRISTGLQDILTKRQLDAQMLSDIEDLLITCDMGLATSQKLVASLKEDRFQQDISLDDIKFSLAQTIINILKPVEVTLDVNRVTPFVIFVVGVNGNGKTTTIGKLAHQFKEQGKKVLLVAGDTFRAAAVEQLSIWAHRLKVPIITPHKQGEDASGFVFEAIRSTKDDSFDVILIDTAGRLHNKEGLMAELEKVVRVLKKINPDLPHETLLILDATTGQNAFTQVETFQSRIGITGLIITKLDGTARGGVLVGLADRFRLPIYEIGIGESAEDLRPFDAKAFTSHLIGLTHE